MVACPARARYGEGFGWIEGLHKYLQPDSTIGEPISGGTALAFAGIIVTGIVPWWPATRRALRAGLTLNFKFTGRPWNLNLHKTPGVYGSIVLLVSALSGAPIALDWLKNSLYPLTGTTKTASPAPIAKSGGAAFAGFEAIAQWLAEIFPDARETFISLPKKGVVASCTIAADAPHANARSYVWFDPSTAQPLRTQPYAQAPRGFRLYYWMLSLHTGMIGGVAMQIVLLLGALAVPVMVWTGVASYLVRRSRQKSSAARARSANLVTQKICIAHAARTLVADHGVSRRRDSAACALGAGRGDG